MTDARRARLYATVCALALVAFAVLAAAVLFWGGADRLDVRFVNRVHTSVPDGLVDAMKVLTYAGSVVVLGPIAIVAGAVLVWRGRPGAALFVVAAFAGSQLPGPGLKAVFRRARPELEDPFAQLATYSFPSGHAFGAAATYGALALVLASAAERTSRRVLVLGVAAALIALVAASRVILGVHYMFDVVGGVVAAVAWVSALLFVLQRAHRRGLRLALFRRHEQPQSAGLDP
ncbi:MAG: phosphatase PAP2 family protein [Actinobacteria bacterium]|nr:phosphatase PAP2 family protein [Actinomycetota bacterium]